MFGNKYNDDKLSDLGSARIGACEGDLRLFRLHKRGRERKQVLQPSHMFGGGVL
ncbi:MAG: hypothetical protein K6B72_06930 [Lachnospiraceae bacterium]|nr:hypothetical protein [Lachnospiraceae bacterium]